MAQTKFRDINGNPIMDTSILEWEVEGKRMQDVVMFDEDSKLWYPMEEFGRVTFKIIGDLNDDTGLAKAFRDTSMGEWE